MKIISGGQVGADIAALKAAKEVGFETGGWMPKGFTTLTGPKPEYVKTFGMLETHDGGYPVRTRLNVETGDVTLRYCINFRTYGERLTARVIGELKKPHLDIHIEPDTFTIVTKPQYVADWLLVYKPENVNVAGNAYSRIEHAVYSHFCKVLRVLKVYGL